MARYFWLVCIGYGIDVASYIGLVNLGAHLYAAYVASFAIGTVCNVLLLRRYFAPGRHAFGKDLAATFASNGLVILLAMAVYIALMQLLNVHHLLAKILSNAGSFLANYYVRRRYF
jgi:putative flippase GtrA